MKRKMLVIGLDGGTWSIFDRFMEAGVMPNLQRLCARGYRAKLMSTIPPVTPTAWASFATGTNPGTHGIYGFTAPHATLESYAAPPARRDLIGQPTLWRRLSDAGLQSTVLCVPLTYPAEPIRGSLVTGMFTPELHSKCTYPASLKHELLANNCMPRFEMNVAQGKAGREGNPLRRALRNNGAEFFADLDDITERLRRAVQYLVKKRWHFFMPVFIGTDRVQHALYDQIISIGPQGTSLLARRIRGFYSKVDSIVGETIKAAGDDTVCMLMSDHGFGACAGKYCLGRWLVEAGYARYQSRRLHRLAKAILEITHTKQIIKRHLSTKSIVHAASSSHPLDWTRSKAFFACHDGIRINLKGREKQGVVEPGAEYETLRRELRERLLKINDPASGKRIISQVWFSEEIYRGRRLQGAPDIMIRASDEPHYAFKRGQIHISKLIERAPNYSGSHRLDGIFLACGPDVKPNADAPPAQITDLAPTILWQLGLPVPDDMDGQIINEAFIGNPPKRTVKVATDTGSSGEPSPASSLGRYTEEEEEALRQRLKNLGYLD